MPYLQSSSLLVERLEILTNMINKIAANTNKTHRRQFFSPLLN